MLNYKDIHGKILTKEKGVYKEPIFLFTSSSLRFAAYTGWYSAFGEEDECKKWMHQAHCEWIKELCSGRRYSFLNHQNDDMYKHIPSDIMDKLVTKLAKGIKNEIKKGKALTQK
jgi:hypothetical protein